MADGAFRIHTLLKGNPLRTRPQPIRNDTVNHKLEANVTLPRDIVSLVMNQPTVNTPRLTMEAEYNIHVSDLMRSRADEVFCPRQHALSYFDRKRPYSSVLFPGKELLFETGHSLHALVVAKIRRWSKWGKFIWGVWKCACEELHVVGYAPPRTEAHKCARCGTYAVSYDEFSLLWPEYRLVGHPDILFLVNGILYIYEIKTVDRRDIDFDNFSSPLADHILQTSFYYHMARRMGFRVAKKIRYVYVDRSSKGIFSFRPYKELRDDPYELERLAPILKKADDIATSIKSGSLPERICKSHDCPRAKNCNQIVACFSRQLTYATATSKDTRPASYSGLAPRPKPRPKAHNRG